MTRHITRLLSVGLFSLILASGCTALTGKTAGTNVDDATITASVKTNLAAERGMQTLTAIDVDTNEGIVSLNGVVESPAAKQRAVEIARQTSGVAKVVNNLQVASR
jgi:hyperosmotically inducible periplasmic protein